MEHRRRNRLFNIEIRLIRRTHQIHVIERVRFPVVSRPRWRTLQHKRIDSALHRQNILRLQQGHGAHRGVGFDLNLLLYRGGPAVRSVG